MLYLSLTRESVSFLKRLTVRRNCEAPRLRTTRCPSCAGKESRFELEIGRNRSTGIRRDMSYGCDNDATDVRSHESNEIEISDAYRERALIGGELVYSWGVAGERRVGVRCIGWLGLFGCGESLNSIRGTGI